MGSNHKEKMVFLKSFSNIILKALKETLDNKIKDELFFQEVDILGIEFYLPAGDEERARVLNINFHINRIYIYPALNAMFSEKVVNDLKNIFVYMGFQIKEF